ncbi:MAG: hypothetical protein ABL919_00250 [Methylococcales bacterium]
MTVVWQVRIIAIAGDLAAGRRSDRRLSEFYRHSNVGLSGWPDASLWPIQGVQNLAGYASECLVGLKSE